MKFQALLLLILLAPLATADRGDPDRDAVNRLLDDFHAAAADGDEGRYLGYLSDDSVYLGTDEWERWPKTPDFRDYVGDRFANGTAWSYKSVERHVRFSENRDVAWFDEVLCSEKNGRLRGTGVLSLRNGQWKVEHYAMSFLILNENWDEVIELTRRTRAMKDRVEPAETGQ